MKPKQIDFPYNHDTKELEKRSEAIYESFTPEQQELLVEYAEIERELTLREKT